MCVLVRIHIDQNYMYEKKNHFRSYVSCLTCYLVIGERTDETYSKRSLVLSASVDCKSKLPFLLEVLESSVPELFHINCCTSKMCQHNLNKYSHLSDVFVVTFLYL